MQYTEIMPRSHQVVYQEVADCSANQKIVKVSNEETLENAIFEFAKEYRNGIKEITVAFKKALGKT